MNFKIVVIMFLWFLVLESKAQKKLDKVSPIEVNGVYSLVVGNVEMQVNPSIGGRITSLKLDGQEFLTGKEVNDVNWGSTLWPSPQSVWSWPPPPVLDSEPYSVAVNGNVLKMVSQKDPKLGLVVTKEFSGDSNEGSFTLKYSITNRADTAQKVAPWEVTRVRTHGLVFFPFGEGERRGGLLPFLVEKDGISWFQYEEDKLPVKGDRQIYSDGSGGWMAQINDRILLVKKFPDVSFEENAPKEGEIELYASPVVPGKSYVEIEHQGPYEEMQPGETSTWQITWYLRKLPDSIEVKAGNTKLVDCVQKLILDQNANEDPKKLQKKKEVIIYNIYY